MSEELCVLKVKGDAKFKGKLTLALKNCIRNLVNFMEAVESLKIENLYFDGPFLSKAYKDLDEKVQKSYIS